MLPMICQSTPWMAHARVSLLAALLLVVTSCDSRDPSTAPDIDGETVAPLGSPPLAIAYSGGIPFGPFYLPTPKLGSDYNGTVVNARIWLPNNIRPTNIMLAELAAIKSRGGKVVLGLAGNQRRFLDEDGHFSLAKWKQQIYVFKSIAFSSYIQDGTIIGHYMIDEPNDKSNFGGRAVPPVMLEEMAKYSKHLWPNMATLVRVESTYLGEWSGSYQYLDAAWAQWVARKGDPVVYISRNVAEAKRKGLALVVGLNLIDGNFLQPLSPSLIRSAGSALLNTSYPCAFLSWQYDANYLSNAGVRDALRYLRSKALNRPFKTCRS
jgi:hypothetical protein